MLSSEIGAPGSEGKEVLPDGERQREKKGHRRYRFRHMLRRAKEQRHRKRIEKGVSALVLLRRFSLKDKAEMSGLPDCPTPTVLQSTSNWKSMKEEMEIDSAQWSTLSREYSLGRSILWEDGILFIIPTHVSGHCSGFNGQ